MLKILIFSLGEKGFSVVNALHSLRGSVSLTCVIGQDKDVLDDYSIQLIQFCDSKNIQYCFRNTSKFVTNKYDLFIAVGWRWMIRNIPKEKLIVFHDSLLPRYRGFSPLICALLNKESKTGVTALLGAEDYDSGNIVLQHSVDLTYPTSIKNEIERIAKIYADMATELITKLLNGSLNLSGSPQNECDVSYSLWRDDMDYRINWNERSDDILHFIDCVGSPYLGASSILNGEIIRIHKASLIKDVKIENRIPGKVIFNKDGFPIVVCGEGLLLLSDIRDNKNNTILPLEYIRIRFT